MRPRVSHTRLTCLLHCTRMQVRSLERNPSQTKEELLASIALCTDSPLQFDEEQVLGHSKCAMRGICTARARGLRTCRPCAGTRGGGATSAHNAQGIPELRFARPSYFMILLPLNCCRFILNQMLSYDAGATRDDLRITQCAAVRCLATALAMRTPTAARASPERPSAM